jgi:hypothetical protein
MNQPEFIWMAKNLKVTDVKQDETGNTIINLRPQIQLTHSYKKKNQMQIIFTEDQARYLISTKVELQEIYRLHLSNVDLENVLRHYCEDWLKKS